MSKNYYFPQFLLLAVVCVYFYTECDNVKDLVGMAQVADKTHYVRNDRGRTKSSFADSLRGVGIDPFSENKSSPHEMFGSKDPLPNFLTSSAASREASAARNLEGGIYPEEESGPKGGSITRPVSAGARVGVHARWLGLAQDGTQVKQIYDAQIGVRETGNNAGSAVEQYLNYVNLKKGEPWCAAFVCWVFGQAGVANPRTGWSPALFPTNKIIWDRGKETKHPNTADIFAIYFAEKGRIAHTGFVDRWNGNWLTTVEGNTNENNSRDGDGVYRKRRMVSSIYKVARYIN